MRESDSITFIWVIRSLPEGSSRVAAYRGDLTVSPFYHQAKNEIVQPGHFVACSRYFVEKWAPRLGGTSVTLILYLRSLGYYNPYTGERRDGVRVGMKQLAKACGCSDRTIQRELENNEWLRYFVRVESSYEQLEDGRIRHHENLYRIAMDDPLIPEDEPRLEALIAERERNPHVPDPATADGRVRRKTGGQGQVAGAGISAPIQNPKSKIQNAPSSPMNDILSLPPADPGRHSVTRVASKCRLKDSEDIPTQNILPEIPNNTPATDGRRRTAGDVVVDSASLSNSSVASHPSPVLSQLTERGVSRVVAEDLVSTFAEADIRLQLEALPHRDAKDPAAVLVKSIRESWALPVPLFEKRVREQQKRRKQEESVQRQAATEQQQVARTEMLERLESYWQCLPAAEQTRIDAEARETLRRTNPFVAQLMERTGEGKIVRATLESLRQKILCARLGLEARVLSALPAD